MGKHVALAVVCVWSLSATAYARELPTNEEALAYLEQIKVHENEFIPGQYEAPQFAADFQAACHAFGFHCMQLFFGVPGLTEHVANVIETKYEFSTIIRRFCLVEPQSNEVVACWLDDEISDALLPGVTWLEINEAYPWFPKDLQESGGDYYFYVDSEF